MIAKTKRNPFGTDYRVVDVGPPPGHTDRRGASGNQFTYMIAKAKVLTAQDLRGVVEQIEDLKTKVAALADHIERHS